MPLAVRYVLIGLAVIAIQWLLLGRIRLWGAYPDVVLLYVAVLALRHGRRAGAISGFGLGMLMDAIYGLWGLHTFIKTLVGFLVGLFPANERETLLIQPQQAFIGGLVIALLHQGLLVTILALSAGVRNAFLIWALWIGCSVYTAFVGMLASLFGRR
jgi:rod shape-determining protein MreD